MPNKLQRLRTQAFHSQRGRCFYCGLPMLSPRTASSTPPDLKGKRTAHHLQCTAEHLNARCDGGEDSLGNVVAAHWFCNVNRHRRKVALSPDRYKTLVRKRMADTGWFPIQVIEAMRDLKVT